MTKATGVQKEELFPVERKGSIPPSNVHTCSMSPGITLVTLFTSLNAVVNLITMTIHEYLIHKTSPCTHRHLTEHQIESISNVVDSTCNKAAGRNFMFTKFARFVSHVKLSFLYRNSSSQGPKINQADDIQRMLSNFETSRDIKYASLTDVPLSELRMDCETSTDSSSTMTISTTQDDNGDLVNTPVTDLPMMGEIQGIAHSARRARQLAKTVFLFMAVAWISLPAFRFFMLCPEIIWFDVTSHSNNKGFCLLTFSCRTSLDRPVVFMWV